jgi:DNA-binding LytR/AlgR family response regulator
MIHIAIVDDEIQSVSLLTDYVHRYETEHGEADGSFQISPFQDGEEILADFEPKYDIILLDVQMDHLDGFSTAKRIRQLDGDVILIFITNLSQYAIRGYEVEALSYLLKPVPYFAFSQELKRSLERLHRREKQYLTIPGKHGLVRLDVTRIRYIESVKHRVILHTTDADHSIVATMKDMETKLQGQGFFRSNSCYLVNLAQVKGIDSIFALVGEDRLQISRPRKKAFLAALTDYLGGTLT